MSSIGPKKNITAKNDSSWLIAPKFITLQVGLPFEYVSETLEGRD